MPFKDLGPYYILPPEFLKGNRTLVEISSSDAVSAQTRFVGTKLLESSK